MHPPLPIAQLFFAVSVVEREHRGGMLRLHESLARLAADALRGRVWRDELRMLRLQPLEPVHQLVEVGVRNLRGIEHVIAILVVADFLAQSFDLFLDVGTGHDWGIIEVLSSRFSVLIKIQTDNYESTLRRGNDACPVFLRTEK